MARRIIRKLLLILSVIMILTSSVQGTLAFLVTKTDSVTNIFIPIRFGGFILDKNIVHPLEQGYVIPDSIVFTFDITLEDGYEGKTVVTNYGSYTADENGKFTVSVRPNSSLIISDLMEGTVVTVTERALLPGFEVKDGIDTYSVTVNKNGNVKIEFINIYTPESVGGESLTLIGKKVLSGRPWQDGDTFTFLLERKVGNEWTEVGKKTVTYDPATDNYDTFEFTDLLSAQTFDSVGEHLFRISEVKGELDRVDYDETVNEFKVIVSDADMDGYLEIKKVSASQKANAEYDSESGKHNVTVTFDNTYVPPTPDDVSVTVKVKKILAGNGAGRFSTDEFSFLLEGENERYSLYASGGYANFDLTFSADDIGESFEYTLTEVKGSLDGVTYSEKIYNIRVDVTLGDDNKLVADITVTCGGEEVTDTEHLEFINICGAATPPTGDDTALYFWGAIFLIGVALFATVIFLEKRKPTTR